jgi:hypothetical protein
MKSKSILIPVEQYPLAIYTMLALGAMVDLVDLALGWLNKLF